MIDVSSIPDFSGDLEQLEKDAGTLKKAASGIRTTGGDVHSKFQGLKSCYTAPEADQLFATTLPVRDGADTFAGKLESVSSALSTFASEARPLVTRMSELKTQAEAFCKSVEGKKDWQKDQDKVDKNASLIHEVGRVWGQFQEAERSAANKISGVAGTGTKWTTDDGSHKKGMYGFSADDAAKADDTPWGKVDKRKYTGLEAAWHWTTDHVGSALKGFFVDGVWGTLKGLGHMVNVFDWDTFKKTWSGIGDVFGGVSAYIMTPYDWAMDKMFGPVDHSDTDRQKKALRDFGKSLVAWDEWSKNPARAGGTVAFNLLTIGSGSLLKLGKAGSLAAKAGEVGEVSTTAKVAGALGKAGRLVDPMTYVGKAGEFVKLQVGDLMSGMKNVYKGTYTDFLNGTGKYKIPETSVQMPDGTVVHHDGTMVHPDGTPHEKPIPVEPSAAERAEHQRLEAEHQAGAPSHDRVPAGVGAGKADGHPMPQANHEPPGGRGSGGGDHSAPGHTSSGGGDHAPAQSGGAADHGASDAGHGHPGGGGSGSGGSGSGQHPPAGGDTPGGHEPAGDGHGSGHSGEGPASSHGPGPAMTPEEKAAYEQHLKQVEQQHQSDFDVLKQDPDHKGKVKPSEMDEARVALDLRDKGKVPEDIQRPPEANQGDLYSPSNGEFYDIKGVHSDWPPLNNVRDKSQPFKGAYDPANNERWVQKLEDQIVARKRIVILDMRNADQAAIDDVKAIVDERGWGDRVVWYP